MAGMTENGFSIKRLPEIKEDLEESARQALGAEASLLPDSVEGTIISVFSQIYAELWEELNNAYGAFNPVLVTDQSLDHLVTLNGLSRLPPLSSRAFLSISGTDNTVIPAGSIVSHSSTGAEFLTENAIEIGVGFPTGTATVFASARFNGAIEALSGTLTVIDSPVNGWDTVINNTDATEGRNAETDSQLRARRARTLTLAGRSSLESIISAIQALSDVTYAGAVENFSDITDANGLPAHSFECVVLGGDNISIAQAIWEKKPAGIEPHGDVSAEANDIFGNVHSMSFSRPTVVPMYLNANITFAGKVPDDASDILTQAFLDLVSGELISGRGLGVGDDVINSALYMAVNLTYSNASINLLETGINGINYDANDRVIAYNELSAWDAARISVVVG